MTIEEPKQEQEPKEQDTTQINDDILNNINEIIQTKISEALKATENIKSENNDLKNKVLENDILREINNSKYLDNSFMEFVKDTDLEKSKSRIKKLDNLIATTVGAELTKRGSFNPGLSSKNINPNKTFEKPSYFV